MGKVEKLKFLLNSLNFKRLTDDDSLMNIYEILKEVDAILNVKEPSIYSVRLSFEDLVKRILNLKEAMEDIDSDDIEDILNEFVSDIRGESYSLSMSEIKKLLMKEIIKDE